MIVAHAKLHKGNVYLSRADDGEFAVLYSKGPLAGIDTVTENGVMPVEAIAAMLYNRTLRHVADEGEDVRGEYIRNIAEIS